MSRRSKQWFKVRSLCTNHTGPDCASTWNQWKRMGKKWTFSLGKAAASNTLLGRAQAAQWWLYPCCEVTPQHKCFFPVFSHVLFRCQRSAVLEKPQCRYNVHLNSYRLSAHQNWSSPCKKSSSFSWPRWPWVAQRAVWNSNTTLCLQHTCCFLLLKPS